MSLKHPEHRPWKVLESEYLIRRPWCTVRCDSVQLPTGAVAPEWYVFEFTDWVNVIAITEDDEFVMISQYRHGVQQTRYELVAGACEPGEDPEQSARRELLEEAGYGGGEWRKFMTVAPNPSNQNNLTYTYLATGVKRISEPQQEETEDIKVHLMSRAEVRSLLEQEYILQCLNIAPLWRYFAENPL